MPSVADIVRRAGPAYLARYGDAMLPSHRRALRDLAECRTAARGGHVSACEACGYEHYTYHSCRNRSCPQCHGAATARWLAAREQELLPVPYFHVVFTLPAALRELVRAHQRVLLGALMTTAADSLQALAADPHYVGGTLGILAVLHTWTRALVYHPHVHCLIPAGALAPDGAAWRPARGNFLVPVRALSVWFRVRFLARLRAALPNAIVPAQVWQTPLVVYCKPAVQGSALVLRYLARYVHRVAITNARILTLTADRVTFAYKATPPNGWRRMTLGSNEFLRRFLQHVLPRGFHKVRYYGLWTPAAAPVRAQLQARLASPAPPSVSRPSPGTDSAQPRPPAPPGLARQCPRCARPLLRTRSIAPVPLLSSYTGVPP
jgi:hypothetical protein